MPTLSPEESRRDVIAVAAQVIAKVAKSLGIAATCVGKLAARSRAAGRTCRRGHPAR